MSLMTRYEEAAVTLDVELGIAGRALKRAYRRMVAKHPPDRDPEGFQRVRAAFELLERPAAAARVMLREPAPAVDPPVILMPRVVRGATALAVLRAAVGRIDAARLLEDGGADG